MTDEKSIVDRSTAWTLAFLPKQWWRVGLWLFGYLLLAVVLLCGVLVAASSLALYVPGMLGRGAAATEGLTAASLEATVSQNLRFAGFGVAGLLLLLCARRGRSVGAVLLPRRAATAWGGVLRFALWASCCLVGMLAVSVIEGWLTDTIGTDVGRSTAGTAWLATSIGATTAAASQAGVVEEVSYVAIPVGLALFLAARHGSAWDGLRSWSSWRPAARWGLFVAVLCAVLARVVIHAYQGPINAGMVAVWALVNVLVFLESGTVLPLILAHFFFDAIAIRSDLTGIDVPAWLGIAAGVGAICVLAIWTQRRRATTALSV
ncbi:hypothetical protein [Leifsonia shinshuensis]